MAAWLAAVSDLRTLECQHGVAAWPSVSSPRQEGEQIITEGDLKADFFYIVPLELNASSEAAKPRSPEAEGFRGVRREDSGALAEIRCCSRLQPPAVRSLRRARLESSLYGYCDDSCYIVVHGSTAFLLLLLLELKAG